MARDGLLGALPPLDDDHPMAMAIEEEPGSRPRAQQPRRLAPALNAAVKEQLDKLLADGRIVPSSSPYAAPILMVKKKDGSYRMVVDYRLLNLQTVRDCYPLPTVQDSLDKLHGCTYFTMLDLSQSYHQLPLKPAHRHKTAFTTQHGLYEFRCVSFGLRNAPSAFSRFMASVVGDMTGIRVVNYLDDLCIASTEDEGPDGHERAAAAALKVIAKHSLVLNGDKSQLGFCCVEMLGHLVADGCIRPTHDRVATLRNFQAPSTVKELRRFLGFTNYMRTFVENYSKIARPLLAALKSDAPPFEWTAEMEAAKAALVDALTSQPALALPDPSSTFTILTDASDLAVGAILMQTRVVAYDSASLNKHQRRYSVRDKELYGLVRALRTWRHLIGHSKVVVLTDHLSLTTLTSTMGLDTWDGRLARWWAFIASFDVDIRYKPGRMHEAADFLSRMPLPVAAVTRSAKRGAAERGPAQPSAQAARKSRLLNGESAAAQSQDATATGDARMGRPKDSGDAATRPQGTTAADDAAAPATPRPHEPGTTPSWLPPEWYKAICEGTASDKTFGPIVAAIRAARETQTSGASAILLPYYAVAEDGSLWHKGLHGSSQLCVPNGTARRELVKFCHEVELCHLGAQRVVSAMCPHYYWPNMLEYIANIVRRCFTCAVTKPQRITYGTLQPLLPAEVPFDHLTMDLASMEPAIDSGHDNILVVTCRCTKFVFAVPCFQTATATDVARMWYEHVYPVAGVPLTVVSDRGPHFVADVWRSFMAALGVNTRLSSPGHAQTDGASERAIGTLRQILRAMAKDSNSLGLWRAFLPRAVFCYNTTRHAATGKAPFYVASLRTPRTLLTVNNNRPQWSEDDTDSFLAALYQDNTDAIVRAGARSARYHDRARKPFPAVRKGDMVLVHRSALGKHAESTSGMDAPHMKLKSMPAYKGPFHVVRRSSNNTVEVDLPAGMRVSRNINVEKLLPANHLDCDKPPPVHVSPQGVEWAVDHIRRHKTHAGKTYLEVVWKGAGWEPTWEPLDNFRHLHVLLYDYFKGRVPKQ